jgi:hypothetical protein
MARSRASIRIFFTPYGATLRSTPFFPVIGNHDYHTSSGQPYLDAFYLPTANSGFERWYSFDHGKVHFIGLDSNSTSGTQTAWLRSDLAAARANSAKWIFVTLHHPGYSSGAPRPLAVGLSELVSDLRGVRSGRRVPGTRPHL